MPRTSSPLPPLAVLLALMGTLSSGLAPAQAAAPSASAAVQPRDGILERPALRSLNDAGGEDGSGTWAAVWEDGFDGGLDPASWSVLGDRDLYALDDSDGRVRFSKAEGGTYDFHRIGAEFLPRLRGDFDVQISFSEASLALVDGRPGNQVQLNLYLGETSIHVVRSDESPAGPNAHVYLNPPGEWRGERPVTRPSGRLRVTRSGALVRAYLDDTRLFEGDLNPDEVSVSFTLQNNGTRDATSVVFDDFVARADAIVAPAPAVLIDTDLQGLPGPAPQEFQLSWNGESGRTYVVESATRWLDWKPLAAPIPGVTERMVLTAPAKAPWELFRLRTDGVPIEEEEFEEELRPFETAELEITDLVVEPAYPAPGERVLVTVTLANSSEVPAQGVTVELSADGTLISEAVLDLPPMDQTTLTFRWSPRAAGPYSLTAHLDPLARIPQYRHADDSQSTTVLVAELMPEVDFSIRSVEWIQEEGQPAFVDLVVRANVDSGAATPLELLTGDRRVLAKTLAVLDAGQTEVHVALPWPADAKVGAWVARLNPRGAALEPVADDNQWSGDFRSPVDLAVEALSLHTLGESPGGKRTVTASFRVTNVGQTDVDQPFAVQSLAVVTGASPPEIQVHAWAPSGLRTGDSLYFTHTLTNLPPAFQVRAEIDPRQFLPDSNRSNNTSAKSLSLEPVTPGQWVALGPKKITSDKGAVGRIHHIAIEPTAQGRNTLYVGAPTGSSASPGGSGVWKTEDGGTTWAPVTDALPSLSVRGLTIDPSHPERVYLVTDEGIYRSPDRGGHWARLSSASKTLTQSYFLVHPSDPNLLLLTTGDGISLSTDGGTNWQVGLSGGAGHNLLLDPNNPDRVLATLFEPGYSAPYYGQVGLWESRSRGAGNTWRQLTGCSGGGLPVMTNYSKAYLAASGSRLYVGFQTDRFRLYRTTSIGCNIGGQPEQLWEKVWDTETPISRIEADPTNPDRVYAHYVGGHFWFSSNGGKGFAKTEEIHMDHHGFAFDPVDPKILYTGSDGGLFRSRDYGRNGSWEFAGEGILNVEVVDLANSLTDPDLMVIGTQDNGTSRSRGSLVWDPIRGGDGSTSGVHPQDANTVYTMEQFAGSLQVRTSQGWSSIGCGLSYLDGRDFKYLVHPVLNGGKVVLYAPYLNQLRRWNGQVCSQAPSEKSEFGSPNQWSAPLTVPSGNVVRVGADPSPHFNDGYIYVGTSNGRLYAAKDAAWGNNPVPVFTHPQGWPVTDIEVSPHANTDVFVTFGAWGGTDRIYQCRRKANPTQTSFFDWTDPIGWNLPNLQVRCLAVDPRVAGAGPVYVGTTRGLWRGVPHLLVGGQRQWAWSAYNEGLPIGVDVSDLERVAVTGLLRAATLGRGVYEVRTTP